MSYAGMDLPEVRMIHVCILCTRMMIGHITLHVDELILAKMNPHHL